MCSPLTLSHCNNSSQVWEKKLCVSVQSFIGGTGEGPTNHYTLTLNSPYMPSHDHVAYIHVCSKWNPVCVCVCPCPFASFFNILKFRSYEMLRSIPCIDPLTPSLPHPITTWLQLRQSLSTQHLLTTSPCLVTQSLITLLLFRTTPGHCSQRLDNPLVSIKHGNDSILGCSKNWPQPQNIHNNGCQQYNICMWHATL